MVKQIHSMGEVLPRQPQAGICMHITSLPGHYGIGELGDAAFRFVDSLVSMNQRVWQILPTGPTAYGDSPYQPLSTFAGNELLIDITALIRDGLLTSHEADRLLSLPEHTVDYGQLIPTKIALLERAAGQFHVQASSSLKADFDQFLELHNQRWLHDYAVFRTLKARHGQRPWPDWDSRFARRDATALRDIEVAERQNIEHIKIIQFLFHRQWRKLHAYAKSQNVLMFGDMPIYIALDSSDAWTNGEILSLDHNNRPQLVAGVPPDYFSEHGQLWGNPVYAWDKHAASGYSWWVERMRHALAQTDLVRIDHFRGFEAYWAVPAEALTAGSGNWLPGPGNAIFDALHNALGRLPIVAEDLGVITPAVEAIRDDNQFPGMQVLQFSITSKDFNVADISDNCVCYTGTHDNDTTLGWFNSLAREPVTDSQQKIRETVLEISGGKPETIHLDLLKLAYVSPARLAMAPLQDHLGLGSAARLNTPGTSANNWRWRLQPEQLRPALLEKIGEITELAGRGIAH